jgi:hypothetical protein
MKKFGTPIGAGPGSAKEKVGFAGVGMPLGATGGAGLGAAGAGLAGFLVAGADVGPWWEVGWAWPGPELDGAVAVLFCGPVLSDPLVEVEGELLCEPPPDPDGVVCVEVLVVGGFVVPEVVVVACEVLELVVVVVGVVVDCGQDSDTDFTGTVRFSEEIGAPTGSWKTSVWPVRVVTVTVQLEASELAGSRPRPSTVAMTPSAQTASLSFLPVTTVSASPPDRASSRLRAGCILAHGVWPASY